MADKAETKPTVDWRDIEALRSSRIASLMQDQRDLEAEEDDIKARTAANRELIYALVAKDGPAVQVGDRVVRWHPESETKKLDAGRLAKAGVTPDQLAAGYSKGLKKGYYEIRGVKEKDAEAQS